MVTRDVDGDKNVLDFGMLDCHSSGCTNGVIEYDPVVM